MGFGTWLLARLSRSPSMVAANEDAKEWDQRDALAQLEDAIPSIRQLLAGKRVVDFGCGIGQQSLAFLRAGAGEVLALDISTERLEKARQLIASQGLAAQTAFASRLEAQHQGQYDVVISQNAMEHYTDAEGVLRQIACLLRPNGLAVITFGPPWYAPYGAHMQYFTKLPWVQLFFSEATIMKVRSRYRKDGAKAFREVDGGLNQMSVAKFERLLAEAGFSVRSLNYRCVKGWNLLGRLPILRELFINEIHAILELKSRQRKD